MAIPVSSQQLAEQLEILIREFYRGDDPQYPRKKIVRVDKKTNDLGNFSFLFANPDQYLRDAKPDVFIYSPSIRSGLSINERGLFDCVFGFYLTGTPQDFYRMLHRVREPIPRVIFSVSRSLLSNGFERLAESTASTWIVGNKLKSNLEQFQKGWGIDDGDVERSQLDIEMELALIQFQSETFTADAAQKSVAIRQLKHLLETEGHDIIGEFNAPKDKIWSGRLAEAKAQIWREVAQILADLEEFLNETTLETEGNFRSLSLQQKYGKAIELGDGEVKYLLPKWIRKELSEVKRQALEDFPGVDWDDAENCYKALSEEKGAMSRGVLLEAMSDDFESVKSIEANQVEAILRGEIRLPHALPRNTMKALLLNHLGVTELMYQEYSNAHPAAIALKEKTLKYAREIRFWLGLNVSADQTPCEIANKLIKRFGVEAEQIARPGKHTGHRDRIYAVPQLLDPFRVKLLESARRGLRNQAAKARGEEVEPFDPVAVEEMMGFLRSAVEAGDEAILAVLDVLATLPQTDQSEVDRRLSRAERSRIQLAVLRSAGEHYATA